MVTCLPSENFMKPLLRVCHRGLSWVIWRVGTLILSSLLQSCHVSREAQQGRRHPRVSYSIPIPLLSTRIRKRKLENASSLLQPPQTHSGNLLPKYSSCFQPGRHLSEQIALSISNRLVVIHRINVSLNMKQQKHSVIKTVYIKVSRFSDVCFFNHLSLKH